MAKCTHCTENIERTQFYDRVSMDNYRRIQSQVVGSIGAEVKQKRMRTRKRMDGQRCGPFGPKFYEYKMRPQVPERCLPKMIGRIRMET